MTPPNQTRGAHHAPGRPDNPYAGDSGPYTSRDEALKQQLIAQGYDPNSKDFWDIFTNMKAQLMGQAAAKAQANKEAAQLGKGADYRDGFQPSDANYKGYDHAALRQMVASIDPQQITSVSSAWTDVANAMATFGGQLGQAATKSGATWKGDSAESAFNFVSSLSKWSDQNGKTAQLAADRVYSASQAAETAKNTMPEEVKFDWTDEMKKWATAGPFGMPGAMSSSYQTYQQSQQAHDQAAGVMAQYDKSLYGVASKAPVFAPPPTFDSSSSTAKGKIEGRIDSKEINTGTGSSGYTGGGVPGGSSPGGPSRPGGSGSGGSGSGGSVPGGSSVPPVGSGSRTGSGSLPGPGSTTPAGYQTPGYTAPGGNNNSTSGLGAMGAMPMGAMGGGFAGGAGGEEYNGKVGRGGGFGPGGSGAATGGGAASGAAKPGGVGAAEAAAGRGAGAAGKSGSSGMGGMGGRGAKGEEDQEHSRPSFLLEGDPDEIFGSDQRTAPPVIGE
jgi:hypothetical protein